MKIKSIGNANIKHKILYKIILKAISDLRFNWQRCFFLSVLIFGSEEKMVGCEELLIFILKIVDVKDILVTNIFARLLQRDSRITSLKKSDLIQIHNWRKQIKFKLAAKQSFLVIRLLNFNETTLLKKPRPSNLPEKIQTLLENIFLKCLEL